MSLRRLLLAALLTGLVVPTVAAAAPLPGALHESTSAVAVPAGVHLLVVDVDAGDVTIAAGAPRGSAHKRWNLKEPTLTSTYRAGTLRLQARCSEGRVDLGVVWVGGPTYNCGTDLTLAVPTGVAVQVVGDRVSVTGLRGAVKVQALSSVTLTRVGPGAVDADSSASTLALRSSNPSVTRLAANSSVTLTDVITGALEARSDSSTLSLDRVTAKTITARANSSVSLSQVRTSSATVGSDSSTVSLSDVQARSPLTVTANSSISLSKVTAPAASIRSDSSTVSVTAVRLSGRLTVTANSSVRVEDTQASSADLRSDSSTLTVRRSPLTDLVGLANSSVSVDLPAVPTHVRLESASSSLELRVPRSAYAVTADSGSGRVHLNDIVIDDRAPRTLELRANSDVTVN